MEVVLKRMLGQLKSEIEARERINAELRIAHGRFTRAGGVRLTGDARC